jgi:hypothetical protein
MLFPEFLYFSYCDGLEQRPMAQLDFWPKLYKNTTNEQKTFNNNQTGTTDIFVDNHF